MHSIFKIYLLFTKTIAKLIKIILPVCTIVIKKMTINSLLLQQKFINYNY